MGEHEEAETGLKNTRLLLANPALAFQKAWTKYKNNELTLGEAARAAGCRTDSQFLELGTRYESNSKAAVPEHLWQRSTPEQQFLLRCLPPDLVEILVQISRKDLLLPKKQKYLEHLWNDLCLLRDLQLITQKDRGELYQFTLSLGH